jgi:hypothetical protein
MGSIYKDYWSCSDCDFNDVTVSGPFRVEAAEGLQEAKIEKRWCNSCEGIRRVFTGQAKHFKPGDEPNSYFMWKDSFNISEIKKERSELLKKKSGFFFAFSKSKKRLIQVEKEITEYEKSKINCKELTDKGIRYYNEKSPPARCLICQSNDVSPLYWESDTHSCGGKFKNDSKRTGSVGNYQNITYSGDGSSVSEMKSI